MPSIEGQDRGRIERRIIFSAPFWTRLSPQVRQKVPVIVVKKLMRGFAKAVEDPLFALFILVPSEPRLCQHLVDSTEPAPPDGLG